MLAQVLQSSSPHGRDLDGIPRLLDSAGSSPGYCYKTKNFPSHCLSNSMLIFRSKPNGEMKCTAFRGDKIPSSCLKSPGEIFALNSARLHSLEVGPAC